MKLSLCHKSLFLSFSIASFAKWKIYYFFPTAGLESNMKTIIICGFLILILLLYLKTSAYTKWLLLKTKLLCVTTISGFLLQAEKSDPASVNLPMY